MADGAPAAAPATAADIGAAILHGVELLQQQAVEAPTFSVKTVDDVYKEGIRAVKSRAPAARINQQWMDAVAGLPAPKPADVERAVAELGDGADTADIVVATYRTLTAARLEKAKSMRLAPALAQAAGTHVPSDGAGARLAMGQLVAQAQGDIVRAGVLLHRDTCNVWIKLHA